MRWGENAGRELLFSNNRPVVFYLPVKIDHLSVVSAGNGSVDVALQADMLDDSYYFGMIQLFSVTGAGPGECYCFRFESPL